MRTRGPTRLVPSGTLTPHGYLAAPNMLCMEDRELQDARAELLYASWRPHWPPHGRSARHTQHRDKHALTRSKTPSIIHSSLPHENGPLHPRIGRKISTILPCWISQRLCSHALSTVASSRVRQSMTRRIENAESLKPHESAPLLSENDSAHRAGTAERARHAHVPRVAKQRWGSTPTPNGWPHSC